VHTCQQQEVNTTIDQQLCILQVPSLCCTGIAIFGSIDRTGDKNRICPEVLSS
jgi:hypothetical protein